MHQSLVCLGGALKTVSLTVAFGSLAACGTSPPSSDAAAVVSRSEALFAFSTVALDSLGHEVMVPDTFCGAGAFVYQWMATIPPPSRRLFDRFRRIDALYEGSNAEGDVVYAEVCSPTKLGSTDTVALRELLKRAEGSVYTVGHAGNSRRPVTGGRVTASLADRHVTLRLEGEEAIGRVFEQRRRWILMSSDMRGTAEDHRFVQVQYRDR